MNKTEFYNKFNNIDPKDELQGVDGLNQILFVRLSMDGLEEMHTYSTDERMYENFEFEAFQSIEDTKQYILKLLNRVEDGNAVYWFIRRKDDNKLIGTAGLLLLDYHNQSIEWGFGVDPDLWGQGYTLQIMEALKTYVFEDLELNRLYGTTFVSNERTIASLQATGMKEEGILREFSMKNGQFIDGWKYSMLKDEYVSSKKENTSNSDLARDYKDSEIIEIVSSVLETKTINIESNISNTTKWDSLNHMAIMIELVNKTNIKFNPGQIAKATSITSILDILNSQK
tara:strand:+ start:818 stop:1672 length:855 start_codon:yes stop_codon:yes gene_type:complete